MKTPLETETVIEIRDESWEDTGSCCFSFESSFAGIPSTWIGWIRLWVSLNHLLRSNLFASLVEELVYRNALFKAILLDAEIVGYALTLV